jgi:hypothetical protein
MRHAVRNKLRAQPATGYYFQDWRSGRGPESVHLPYKYDQIVAGKTVRQWVADLKAAQ